MSNSQSTQTWFTLGLFAVLAMNTSWDFSNHQIRVANAKNGISEMASKATIEKDVRFGDCNLKLRGKKSKEIQLKGGKKTQDFVLNCSECDGLPSEIKVIPDVPKLELIVDRLEETVRKAGYECKKGRIARVGSSTTKKPEKKEKKEKKGIDYRSIIDKELAKCSSEDETTDELECYSDAFESLVEDHRAFDKKRDAKAQRELARAFNRKFKKVFVDTYKDNESDVDRVALWESLSKVMSLKKAKNGSRLADAAKKLKNSVIGHEANKLMDMRKQMDMVCLGLMANGMYNSKMTDTFQCNNLRKALPAATSRVNFELGQQAAPSIANAYMDKDIVSSQRKAQRLAYEETFAELSRQFQNYSRGVVDNLMTYTNRSVRRTGNSAIPNLSTVNSTLGFSNQDILGKLMNTSPAAKRTNLSGPRVSLRRN